MNLSNLHPAEGSKHSDSFRRGREVIGTGLIGSVLSYPVMTYLWGRTGLTWMFYVPSFLMGTIIGGSIAYVLLKSMSRSGILENIQRKLGVQKFVETNE